MAGRHPKYARLTARLRTLAPGQDALSLSFAELAALAGPLPRGAWTSVYWRSGTVPRANWERAGWRAHLDRHTETVEFRRAAERPGAPENARPPARKVAHCQDVG